MTPTERRQATCRALEHLREQGRKRAAVFAAIAEDLEVGQAKVPYWTIVRRIIQGPLFIPIAQIDPLIDRLVADGYLVIVTEGEQGVSPRVWDLGPVAVGMAVAVS